MKKKLLFTGMLVMALAFGLVVVGCDNGNGDPKNNGPTGGKVDKTGTYSISGNKLTITSSYDGETTTQTLTKK